MCSSDLLSSAVAQDIPVFYFFDAATLTQKTIAEGTLPLWNVENPVHDAAGHIL